MSPLHRRTDPRSRQLTALLISLWLVIGPALYSSAQPSDWAWVRAMVSDQENLVSDVVVDEATGAIYATGTYKTAGPFGLPAPYGGTDAFLVKLSSAGTMV